jgi:hypothetical protein
MTDILYPLKHQEDHEELRYSLRSLKNLKHDKVFISGHIPDWTTMVIQCPKQKIINPRNDVFWNIRRALDHPQMDEQITVFNDDMYVLEKMDTVGSFHGKEVGLSTWGSVSRPTMSILKSMGCWSAYSTEQHMPFMCEKTKLKYVLDMILEVEPDRYGSIYWRTIYSNYWKVKGEFALDVKVRTNPVIEAGQKFISSEETTFEKHLKPLLHKRFKGKSVYEK